MRANQLRIYLAGVAYVLMQGLRRFGLKGPGLERAQARTIRFRLLKIVAQIRWAKLSRPWANIVSDSHQAAPAQFPVPPKATLCLATVDAAPQTNLP